MRWRTGTIMSLLAVFAARAVVSQPVGIEWINFNQQYYKIPVAEDGIYRITYTELQNAGIPVNTINPRRIQIFHRGQEMGINVEGQDDDQLNPGDFIEFYGQFKLNA